MPTPTKLFLTFENGHKVIVLNQIIKKLFDKTHILECICLNEKGKPRIYPMTCRFR